jgi:hypothetical protein
MSLQDVRTRLAKLERELARHKALIPEHESKINELTVRDAVTAPTAAPPRKPTEASSFAETRIRHTPAFLKLLSRTSLMRRNS